uniref:Uncharacterized protein n=1 Tax=Octopus bimaculoides TaxID=37653 RepID=A0A0L8G2W5_OCTBM
MTVKIKDRTLFLMSRKQNQNGINGHVRNTFRYYTPISQQCSTQKMKTQQHIHIKYGRKIT